jgi:hypothetical protein
MARQAPSEAKLSRQGKIRVLWQSVSSFLAPDAQKEIGRIEGIDARLRWTSTREWFDADRSIAALALV